MVLTENFPGYFHAMFLVVARRGFLYGLVLASFVVSANPGCLLLVLWCPVFQL